MHSRRVLAVAVVSVLLLQQVPAYAAFTDLDGSPYESAILALAGAGIVSGYPDGTTRPYAGINRAEALKVAVAAQKQFGQELSDTKGNMPAIPLFADVNQQSWYAPYLEVAFSEKVVTGYPDNLFRPYTALKTEEAIAIALRTFHIDGDPAFRTSPNIDNRPGEWFTPYVSAAIAKGAIGQGSNLRIGQPISRGEFFLLVNNLRNPGPVILSANTASSQPATQVYVPASSQSSQQQVLPVQPQQPVQQQFVGQQPVQQISSQQASSQAPVRRAEHTGVVEKSTALQFASGDKPFAISIPSIGIVDLGITHPADPTTQKGVLAPLQTGVGHLFAYPGQGSKIMIYGHSSSYPWDLSQYTKIFRTINKVPVGDRIYVTYNGELYVYEVVDKRTIPAKDTKSFEPDVNGEQLILYTCWPPDTIDSRYLIIAMPIDVIAMR